MGCCGSKPESPYNTQHEIAEAQRDIPNESSRAAIHQPSEPSNHGQSSRAGASSTPGVPRPNQPIKRPEPLLHSPKNVSPIPPPWTRSHLEDQRRIFFETRVTGQPVIWSSLRLVCEFLRQDDVAGAQAVMDAAHISCPYGVVARSRGKERQRTGVYDEQGKLYELPLWLVADPQDIIEDADEKDIDGTASDGAESLVEQVHKEEKGKGRAEDVGEELSVKVRLSSSVKDVEVAFGAKQNVAIIAKKVQESVKVSRCRLLYLGKPLDANKTLVEQGWQQGRVLNAFVFEE